MAKKKDTQAKMQEMEPIVHLEQLQRLQAEFINYRNRVEKEKVELQERARELVLMKFLDVKDNFDRAPKLDEGMDLIYKQFQKIFQEEAVEVIPTEKFDPTMHEAIATDNTKEKDTIIEVFQTGYLRNNTVIRPAKVVVGSKETKENKTK